MNKLNDKYFDKLRLENIKSSASLYLTRSALKSFVLAKERTPFSFELCEICKRIVEETAKLEWGSNTHFNWRETELVVDNLEHGERSISLLTDS